MKREPLYVRTVNGDGPRCGCGERSRVRVHRGGLHLGVIKSDVFLCAACVERAAEGHIAWTGQRRFRVGVAVGEVVRVFDGKTWAANGYDHPDGNERYFLEAEILAVYDRPALDRPNDKEALADVRFLHDGRVSHGHFVDGMMPVEP